MLWNVYWAVNYAIFMVLSFIIVNCRQCEQEYMKSAFCELNTRNYTDIRFNIQFSL